MLSFTVPMLLTSVQSIMHESSERDLLTHSAAGNEQNALAFSKRRRHQEGAINLLRLQVGKDSGRNFPLERTVRRAIVR